MFTFDKTPNIFLSILPYSNSFYITNGPDDSSTGDAPYIYYIMKIYLQIFHQYYKHLVKLIIIVKNYFTKCYLQI
jgi:hypothetical protein